MLSGTISVFLTDVDLNGRVLTDWAGLANPQIKRNTPDAQNPWTSLTDFASFQTLLFRQEASAELNEP